MTSEVLSLVEVDKQREISRDRPVPSSDSLKSLSGVLIALCALLAVCIVNVV